jgi:hypothetical protein
MRINTLRKKKLLLLTVSLCLLRKRKHRKPASCWVRSWLNRRETLGISTTLVRELEKEDIMEYTAMFRMDKEKFDYWLKLVSHGIERHDTFFTA